MIGWFTNDNHGSQVDRIVWVIRHARTSANEAGVLQGWERYPLSSSGQRDASLAARWWRQHNISWVVSSPVHRALETARVIFGRVDEIDSGWGEQATPDLEGKTGAVAHALFPELIGADGWSREDAARSAAVEHILTVQERGIAALRRSAIAPSGGEVAVVTHGAVLVALLRRAGSEAQTVGNLAAAQFLVSPIRGWELVEIREPLTESCP